MLQFKNIFEFINSTININFKNLVIVRKSILLKQGFDVENINWDLYTKVLEEKYRRLKSS